MERNPIYLVIGPRLESRHRTESAYTDCVLQVRTNLDPIESYRFDRTIDGGDVVLKVPEPIIEIARGRRDDLYGQANKLFGARWGAWSYAGSDTWTYQIQNEGDLKPPLIDRERNILAILKAYPRQTADVLFHRSGSSATDKSAVDSALRYLYESGYVVRETSGQQIYYSLRSP